MIPQNVPTSYKNTNTVPIWIHSCKFAADLCDSEVNLSHLAQGPYNWDKKSHYLVTPLRYCKDQYKNA